MSCSALARDHRTCFDTLAEVVEQPSFPEEELAKVKSEMTAGVRARLDDAAKLASAHVQNLLWGDDHVRGWIDSEASVASLHRDDLVAWHKTWFAPNNAMLVVTGDVDAKKLRPEIDNAFGGWRKANLPPTPSYHEPGLSGIRIRLVDKPGQTQTHIRIAQFGIKHDDPRFFDSLVWNHVLGSGDFSSRLMKVVRVNGNKTYGAGTSFDRNADRGSFVASTYTRNAEALETTKLVLARAREDGEGWADAGRGRRGDREHQRWLRCSARDGCGSRRRAARRGATRFWHRIRDELPDRGWPGRRRVGEAGGSRDHRPPQLRDRAGRRR